MKQMKKSRITAQSLLGFKFVDDVCESSSASQLDKYSSITTSTSVNQRENVGSDACFGNLSYIANENMWNAPCRVL